MEVQEQVQEQVLPLALLFLRKGFQRIQYQMVRQGLRVLRRAVLLLAPARRLRLVFRGVGQKAARLEGPRGVHLEGLMVAPTVVCLVDLMVAPTAVRLEGLMVARKEDQRGGL